MMGPRWAGRVLGGGSCRCWMITAGSGARAQGGCGCECAHAYAHAHACACACAHAPVRILQPLSFLKLKYVITDMPHVQVRALARAQWGRPGERRSCGRVAWARMHAPNAATHAGAHAVDGLVPQELCELSLTRTQLSATPQLKPEGEGHCRSTQPPLACIWASSGNNSNDSNNLYSHPAGRFLVFPPVFPH